MLPKLSSFFQVVFKEMHVSLSNVESVREKEKSKALAAAKKISEDLKRAMSKKAKIHQQFKRILQTII